MKYKQRKNPTNKTDLTNPTNKTDLTNPTNKKGTFK
jgi:hypothetical protein